MVQTIKKHLKVILNERYSREYVLKTLLTEIEGIVNSRLRTFNSSNPDDLTPITLNDLLIGPNCNIFLLAKTDESDTIILT